jgi:hypothetical protein
MTPIECSTLAPIFDLVRFFARSISSAVAVTPIGEILGF